MKRGDAAAQTAELASGFAAALIKLFEKRNKEVIAAARAIAIDHVRASLEESDGRTDTADGAGNRDIAELEAKVDALKVRGLDEDEQVAADPPRARAARRVDAEPTAERRRANTCRKCGAVGFTARTCGKTHNVAVDARPDTHAAPPAPADDARDDDGEEAPRRREPAALRPVAPPPYSARRCRPLRANRGPGPSSRRSCRPMTTRSALS